jgi:signal transduction histidine kinase
MRKLYRSLLAQSVLWIILPQSLVMIAIAVGSFLIYQRVVISLLIDRDRQLAVISASRISQELAEHAAALESLIEENIQGDRKVDLTELHLRVPLETLGLYNAGVVVVDAKGKVLAVTPTEISPTKSDVFQEPFFQEVRIRKDAYFSDVLIDQGTGQQMIVISVPIYFGDKIFDGAILGALHFESSQLSNLIKGLKVGDEGFAYLVDGTGRVICHPDSRNVGLDFSNRLFVDRVVRGMNGGYVETLQSGERLVVGFAPIEGTGWGLIVREPWEEVIEPVRVYGAVVILMILLITVATTWFLWVRVRRIAKPIQQLGEQASRLGSGGAIESVVDSGISEIDGLASAFARMAGQIVTYRAGLQRYLRAITQSQDEERRRVARELHDETIQNMLAIDRQLELFLTSEDNPDQRGSLRQIHEMVQETIRGVRQISRNLRPLVLEDLGLIPAIESLISVLHDEEPGLNAALHIVGNPQHHSADHELALYRITQEALTNCRKHAGASRADVRLTFEDASVRLEIQDDGRGFSLPSSMAEFAHSGSFGLMGIQERVFALGGEFNIDSGEGEGTRLEVVLPLTDSTG